VDWEVELAIVIGKEGKNIAESDAMDHIFGFTVAHDVTSRDWQLKRNGGQWLLGKSMDAFCPIGPVCLALRLLFRRTFFSRHYSY
jgi:2-keto-4-pentenoate hydratase/2-oxohepta-3-ene-1,7-dioic acid hydratase in catechol pathway